MATAALRKLIAQTPVLVLSKSKCPFCAKAKSLLDSHKITPLVIELDSMPNGPALQASAISLTKHRTVPSIFVHGKHIGGYDSLALLLQTHTAARPGASLLSLPLV